MVKLFLICPLAAVHLLPKTPTCKPQNQQTLSKSGSTSHAHKFDFLPGSYSRAMSPAAECHSCQGMRTSHGDCPTFPLALVGRGTNSLLDFALKKRQHELMRGCYYRLRYTEIDGGGRALREKTFCDQGSLRCVCRFCRAEEMLVVARHNKVMQILIELLSALHFLRMVACSFARTLCTGVFPSPAYNPSSFSRKSYGLHSRQGCHRRSTTVGRGAEGVGSTPPPPTLHTPPPISPAILPCLTLGDI